MPEKVRVSPAAQAPLSTGHEDQAALLLLELPDDDPPDEFDELDEEEDDDPFDDEDPLDEDDPESDEDDEDDEAAEVSLLAGTVLVPVERLSFR
jgi:hypothetical protein